MKVTCNPFIYSGTCDGLVYYYNKRLGTMIARKYVCPRQSSQNRCFAAISRNLKALNISPGYKSDLNTYIALAAYSGNAKRYTNWLSVFVSLMYAMAKLVPEIDLLTINRNQIETMHLPCITVYSAIQAGLIQYYPGCEGLTNGM